MKRRLRAFLYRAHAIGASAVTLRRRREGMRASNRHSARQNIMRNVDGLRRNTGEEEKNKACMLA